MLPDWIDPEMLQWIILAAIALLFYSMFLVARFIQKAIMKFVLFVILAGIGLSLWIQREELENCVDTCECSLYGAEVQIPDDRRVADCR